MHENVPSKGGGSGEAGDAPAPAHGRHGECAQARAAGPIGETQRHRKRPPGKEERGLV